MGWNLAVTLAQHAHRNQMSWTEPGAGLSADEEWRKDRMVPLVLNELVRRWWQVYVDNWDAGTVGPRKEMAEAARVQQQQARPPPTHRKGPADGGQGIADQARSGFPTQR